MDKIKQLFKYPLLVGFCIFMLMVFTADMLTTRRQYSEMENRTLKQRPTFTWSSLVKNEYTLKYEEFVNDQFVARDSWITLKSISESVFGKIENNGVTYGQDAYLFAKKTTPEQAQLQRNITFLKNYFANQKGSVTLGIIPNSYAVLQDKLPTGLEYISIDQGTLIDNIYAQTAGENVTQLPLLDVMKSHANEEIYYRTDHHWTTYGAWYAYKQYCDQKGLAAVTREELEPLKKEVPGFYGTYYSKTKNFDAVADTITYYDIPITDITINSKKTIVDSDKQEIPLVGLYQNELWEKRDKYAAFLYGNNGLTVIKSDNNLNKQEGKTSRLLLIKDSYSNCLVPYLTYSYDELYVVDLRGLGTAEQDKLKRMQFDDIFVLYNYESFESDRNFAKLTM